jgi:deoxyribonuclease IV
MSYHFGVHACSEGGIDMAARRAANAGFTTLQIFTLPPQYFNDRSSISGRRVEAFAAALRETGIRPEHVLVHAAYVLNTATADEAMWERARNGLKKELERSAALGVGAICFHPGSPGRQPDGAGERVARAITTALEAAPGNVRLLIENTAGAGATFGRTAQEVADTLALVPDPLRPRTGYGLDTCHLFASGYDLRVAREALTDILDEWEETVGEPPAFFHLNDSAADLGSNRDRHELLGEGRIGVEPFRWLLADPRAQDVPLILETPQQNPDIARDDPSPDPHDLKMRERLATLVG